ncbi:MAG: hypothetical protein H5T92_00110 [Synergistales bacterium]|nr:hypothetical protein [Synergistales bacterium]
MHERLKGIDLGSGEEAKRSIRYHAENDVTWEHHEIAKQLYGWTDIFRDRFLDPIARLDRQGRLPGPVLGFETFDHRAYAYYLLGHNAHGLEDEIILNEVHLNRPLYSILETVLHEQIHLWQQRFGEHPVTRNYHNKEFCQKAEALGLHPEPGTGCHLRPADGPFEALLREYGIYKPPEELLVPKVEKVNWWELFKDLADGGERKGRSTLTKWSCGCQNVRVGTKEFYARCTRCGELFVRVDGRGSQTLYEAREGKEESR